MMNFDWQNAAQKLAENLIATSFEFFGKSFIRSDMPPLAVACSGGADSLAALLLTWAKFPETRGQICVLHFDHAVRKESAEDAEFVREICAELGVEFVCERRVPLPGKISHSEANLRSARLDFFIREMRSRNIKILVQGHQRDDVAETLLMRLTRGAGTDGLAAPRKISPQADGRIFVRPLLDFPKEKILTALRNCKIPWREDTTNAGTDYFRNRVRNRVLPELRAIAPFENIARSRKLAEEDADALDFFANEIFKKTKCEKISSRNDSKNANAWKLRLSDENSKNVILPAIVRRVLRKIFTQEKLEPNGAAIIDALVTSVCAGTPQKKQIGKREIIWDGKCLRVQSENFGDAPETLPLHWTSEKVFVTEELFEKICTGTFPSTETAFLAGTPDIFVRKLFPGEKFRPLGAPGEKSVLRIFTDKKIPQERRKNLLVFADGMGIAWIPGLPPAERFRIRSAGTPALRLTYRKASLT